jgi:hypothetical protein
MIRDMDREMDLERGFDGVEWSRTLEVMGNPGMDLNDRRTI